MTVDYDYDNRTHAVRPYKLRNRNCASNFEKQLETFLTRNLETLLTSPKEGRGGAVLCVRWIAGAPIRLFCARCPRAEFRERANR